MNWMDYGLMALIGIALLLAVKMVRTHKDSSGCCGGNCSACKGCRH